MGLETRRISMEQLLWVAIGRGIQTHYKNNPKIILGFEFNHTNTELKVRTKYGSFRVKLERCSEAGSNGEKPPHSAPGDGGANSGGVRECSV
jgi:hypothetical protein